MITLEKTVKKTYPSIKTQTLAAILAVIGSVIVPQLFHAIGAVSGLGTLLGESFLPMHLPIFIVGLLAGPYAGAVAGVLGPLTSHFMTGMPGSLMLPFMMVELCAYGIVSGIFRNIHIPVIAKLLITQIVGRIIRAAAILIAIYLLGNESLKVSIIWSSIATGIPGLILQWSMLPILMYCINAIKKNEQ